MIDTDDRVALHELAARYGDAIDAGDWEGLAGIFTDDAVFDLSDAGGPRIESLDELRKFMSDAPNKPIGHHITNIHVDAPAGGPVLLRSRVVSVREAVTTSGSYVDEVVKTDSGWRIAVRSFTPGRRASA
jgi:ketosteroid isomerase-like protein